ncbi:MAG: site-specific integrase [Gallionella sp.]|nr:site-specific integrase [Gallionella sp.]
MATITKTPSGTWKALIRKAGWPTTSKTFRTKRDAEDWSRRTEDEMVRGVFIQRAQAERLTLESALDRYLKEVSITKSAFTQRGETSKSKQLKLELGKYSLAAITPDLVAAYRDKRLEAGKQNNTVRLELALLGHLFTVAMREWGVGLAYNPVTNIRKPSPGKGRNRRLTSAEEAKLIKAVSKHSNPMLGWIVRAALATAMRSTEIVTLRRSQVDINRRVIHLTKTKNGSERTVPLTLAAKAVFDEALANPVRPIDCDLIFFGEPGEDKKTRKPYQFNKAFGIIKKEIGLADFHFHDIRHEAVSRLVEAGLSDQQVSAISGHTDMNMLKKYTHLRAEDLVGELDAAFSAK